MARPELSLDALLGSAQGAPLTFIAMAGVGAALAAICGTPGPVGRRERRPV